MTMTSLHALHDVQPSVTLVERMVAIGLLSEHQLRCALREKKQVDRPLGEILVQMGMISQKVLDDTLAELLGDQSIDMRTMLPDTRALAMLPKETAERHCLLPIEFDERAGLLTLAVRETLDFAGLDEISECINPAIEIETVTADAAGIRAAIDRVYDVALTIPDILREIDSDESNILRRKFDPVCSGHPLQRLVDAILVEAVRCNATAIHFEPDFGFVRVRFRIDGVLSQFMVVHQSYWPGMVARLAALSDFLEEEGDVFSEASAPRAIGTRRKRLQMSRRSTLAGDDYVMRIVPADRTVLPLEQLGLDNESLRRLQLMMARPHGMLVIAGPPGCGKTSTLYSMLDYRSDESVSIVTLEEQVCCPASAVRQAKNAESILGCDVDRLAALRHQDFDVLVIDELRDGAGANVALHFASTGRQVYAVAAAKSALQALSRLDELGLQRSHIAGNLVGIVAQRLLRVLCMHCKQAYTPTPIERGIVGANDSDVLRLYREGGCERCQYRGFAGRIAIFEVLGIDETLEGLLANGETVPGLRQVVSEGGFVDFGDAAVRQVLAGATSLAEASRVVDLSARLK